MRALLRRAACALAVVVWAGGLDAAAWAPQTRLRMIDEATRFMPASLRAALARYRDPLLRGALEPLTGEDGPEHRSRAAGGHLDRRVAEEIEALIATLGRPTPFGEVARRFGAVAHYVLDASFPPAAGAPEGPPRYAHFTAFCQSRLERFPLVFGGHADARLAAGDWGGFAAALLRAAGEDDRRLALAYAAAGDPPAAEAFDDRSIPFAVGSLSYSRGVNSLVRVWLAVWQRVGGDMAKTPYWEPAPAPDEEHP